MKKNNCSSRFGSHDCCYDDDNTCHAGASTCYRPVDVKGCGAGVATTSVGNKTWKLPSARHDIILRDASAQMTFSLPAFDELQKFANVDDGFGYVVETGIQDLTLFIHEGECGSDGLCVAVSENHVNPTIIFFDESEPIVEMWHSPSPIYVLDTEKRCELFDDEIRKCHYLPKTSRWEGVWKLPSLPRDKHLLLVVKIPMAELEQPSPILENTMRTLMNDDAFADFTFITSDGARTTAHKCLLAQRSAVFRAMFSNPMKESNTGSMEVAAFNKATLEFFLHHVYVPDSTFSVECVPCDVDVCAAAKFACMHGFTAFTKQCLEYMSETVCEYNVVEYLKTVSELEQNESTARFSERCLQIMATAILQKSGRVDRKCNLLMLQLAETLTNKEDGEEGGKDGEGKETSE